MPSELWKRLKKIELVGKLEMASALETNRPAIVLIAMTR